MLPAGFVVQLEKETPLEVSKYHEIVAVTGISFIEENSQAKEPLLQLVARTTSGNALDSSNNRGCFVVSFHLIRDDFKQLTFVFFQTLPNQSHCYFLSDHDSLNGYMVKKIPFSHPAHVPRIVEILRKQAAFNAVISSCIRPNSIQGKFIFHPINGSITNDFK